MDTETDTTTKLGTMPQLEQELPCKQSCVGSSPTGASIYDEKLLEKIAKELSYRMISFINNNAFQYSETIFTNPRPSV